MVNHTGSGKSSSFQGRQLSRSLAVSLTVLCVIAGGIGLVALVLEYGLVRLDRISGLAISGPPVDVQMLHWAQCLGAAIFVLAAILELVAAREVLRSLKDHFFEVIIAVVAGLGLLIIAMRWRTEGGDLQRLAIWAVQIYLVLRVMSVFVRLNVWFSRASSRPMRTIVISFVVLILLGASLLSLPCATYNQRFTNTGENLVDALFTATSAVCVTGLTVRDTGSDFTPFGQLVILVLIQIGGLGVIIFGTIFALLIGQHITLRETAVVQDIYSSQAPGQITRIVKFVVISTLLIETVGVLLCFNMWNEVDLTLADRIFKSIFYAVSAYCNAGFALTSDSLMGYAGHWQVYGVIMVLIILGGLGFPVLQDIARVVVHKLRNMFGRKSPAGAEGYRPVRFSLQSKIVLSTSIVLILAGSLLLYVFERPPDNWHGWGKLVPQEDLAARAGEQIMRYQSSGQRFLGAVFQAVSCRTAGFNTVDTSLGALRPASFWLLMAMMFIGGSPASTAGGIKTVTVALLIAAVVAALRQRHNVEMFHRTIEQSLIRRALTLAILFFALVWTVSLVLVVTHPQMSFLALLFESFSACGTVGFSTGITSHLSLAGRLTIIAGMFIGRLGPLTLLLAMTRRPRPLRYEYPREAVLTG